ncbi:MAG: hypothetical protein ACLTDR_05910 [Adlercreutzia equolifaciens]
MTSLSATSTTPPTTMPWRRWPETSRYEIASRRHFGDTTLDLLERLCTE